MQSAMSLTGPSLCPPSGIPPQLSAERRQRSRISKPPLIVSGLPGDVEDVSEGGFCMRLKDPPPVGQRYELIVTDGLVNFTREFTAEVLWNRPGLAGFRWVGLTPALERWLQNRFAQWPGKYRVLIRVKSGQVGAPIAELSWSRRLLHRGSGKQRRLRLRKVNLSGW